MQLEDLYNEALGMMENTVHLLANRVPSPVRVPFYGSFAFRYIEKSIYQALVQKLARNVSTLNAAKLLMESGYAQEQAALQRMLDEMQEDITFLAFSVIFNKPTPLHQKYLDAFFEEEFDAETALASTQKRHMIPRKKIHAYIARIESNQLDTNRGIEISRTISKTYSGYVHAASPHIMDMYGGHPAKFQMRGMLKTVRHIEQKEDLWNYFYRSILAFGFATKAFGDDNLFQDFLEFSKKFSANSGKDIQSIYKR